jgi:hypothetical protein
MTVSQDETGCAAFNANVSFDASETGAIFRWGVINHLAERLDALAKHG